MPQYNRAELGRMATESGFVRDTFEKVLRLKEILRFMNEDEFLREHLLLKGGTAINLTVFNLPRLSVDIDMDYTPNDTREDMLECREKITNVIKEYMESEGYLLSDASRFSHSLDAFHYNYQNAGGNKDMIKIELNYSLRAHIFEPVYRSILPSAFDDGLKIRMVNPMEIFAAKGNALITRAAARDLYDWCNMLSEGLFEEQRDLFRKCFLFYMTISADTLNKSFDTSAIDTLDFNKIRRDLFPVLNKKDNFQLDERKKIAKNYISDLMVLTTKEKEYLDRFEEKKYMPVDAQIDELYAWHGHITKLNGKNTIILMNDRTMYSLIFRNRLPRNVDKFTELIKEAITYTMEVGGFNNPEIDKYMSGVGEIIFAEKADRQMTGNLTRMFLDMEYTCDRWQENESVQAEQAAFENNGIRRQGKEYVKPFERMLDELDT